MGLRGGSISIGDLGQFYVGADIFQCFEGIDLHHTRHPDGTSSTEVLRLTTVHCLVSHLLGPAYETCYLPLQETAA